MAAMRVVGPFDFVAIRGRGKTLEVRLVDVKVVAPSARAKQRSQTQQLLGVQLVYVDLESGGVATTVGRARRGEKTKILD